MSGGDVSGWAFLPQEEPDGTDRDAAFNAALLAARARAQAAAEITGRFAPWAEYAPSMRDTADNLRLRAGGLEIWRIAAPPHAASLALDLLNRLKGTAQAYEALAAELEHPTPDDEPHVEGIAP